MLAWMPRLGTKMMQHIMLSYRKVLMAFSSHHGKGRDCTAGAMLLEAGWACLAGRVVQQGRCVLLRPASITAWGCWEKLELQSCSPDFACLLYLLHLRHAGCWVCRCLSAMGQMLATAAQGQMPCRVSM